MISFFKKLFGKTPEAAPEAQNAAPSQGEVMIDIAENPHDVAAMAGSPDADVRVALALRLVDVLPNLSSERHSQLYAYAVQALMSLAQDEVFKVRRSLTTALADYAKAPPSVVARLARDVEREIAEPILRRCIALPEEDILDILGSHPEPWVISSIAARPIVSEKVADAVIATRDVKGTQMLISNSGAKISVPALQRIVDRARNHPEWHRPLALRPDLTVDLTREMAGFVGETILTVLKERSDLDAATRKGVAALVERRMTYVSAGPAMTPAQKVELYAKEGRLTHEAVQDALAWQEKEFAALALAKLAGIPADTVKRMISSGARPIVALCWKAQMPVRLCVDVQRLAGRIQPRELLYPRGGTDYPLTPDEISWQLEFFGVKK